MLVPLFMTVSLLSHARHARHHVPPRDRQVSGRLGGQTRTRTRVRSSATAHAFPHSSRLGRRQPAPLPSLDASAPQVSAPQLYVLMLPARPAAPLPLPSLPHPLMSSLPHPLMPLAVTPKFTLQPTAAQEEDDLITAINNARAQCGLGPLALDPLLCTAARAHSQEMCDLHYFDHQSPTDGQQTPLDRYLAVRRERGEGRPHRMALGENIFYASQTDSTYNAGYAHQSLMASPEHRDNILAPRFTKVGVGLCRAADGRFWVTEMFLQDN